MDENLNVGAVLIDLSKAFVCISHDLIIAKLVAYGADKNVLCFVYSYLKDCKQCVKISNRYNSFRNIIPGVPQGCILGPFFFNISFNDFFFYISLASVHNFADANIHSRAAKSVNDLISTLKSESNLAIKLLHYYDIFICKF